MQSVPWPNHSSWNSNFMKLHIEKLMRKWAETLVIDSPRSNQNENLWSIVHLCFHKVMTVNTWADFWNDHIVPGRKKEWKTGYLYNTCLPMISGIWTNAYVGGMLVTIRPCDFLAFVFGWDEEKNDISRSPTPPRNQSLKSYMALYL